jgi:hypothetical protein
VRALLLHLEDVGFEGAPRHLGTDERGRDVLSCVDGDVPQPPYPGRSTTDRALGDLGRLAAAYGLEPGRAGELVELVLTEHRLSRAHIRERIATGDPAWIERWAETGGERTAAADAEWLARRPDALVAAVEAAVSR